MEEMSSKALASLEGKNLLKTVEFLQDQGYEVVYVALYGAQNYNLQREGSDFDYKAVVVPKLEDVVFNVKPTSVTLNLPEIDGQVDVKDIRLMIDQWKKGASNFVELLFSDWFWINPEYYLLMSWFRENAEQIAFANVPSAVKAMGGMIEEKFHALDHPYPVQVDEVNEFGYAAKQLSHEMRLASMLKRFMHSSYAELLKPSGVDKEALKEWDDIREIKTHKGCFSKEEAIAFGQALRDWSKAQVDNLLKVAPEVNEKVIEKMDRYKFAIIKLALQKELKE